MIAFVGSVFSPYYALAGRRSPENHVAINIALYGPHGRLWAMTERGRGTLSRDRDRFEVGPSRLEWRGDRLRIGFDEIAVPQPPQQLLPRRVRGVLDVIPEMSAGAIYNLDGVGRHLWWPIAPRARIEVALDHDPALRWQGHGYLDSNWGARPLEHDFKRWDWARGKVGGGDTVILYDTMRRDGSEAPIALRIDERGDLQAFDMPERRALPRGLWGVKRTIGTSPEFRPRLLQVLEDSPFYARALIETQLFGEKTVMIHESFDGDRLASPLVKLMLPFRMPRRFW